MYELNEALKPISHDHLGDPDVARKAAEAVESRQPEQRECLCHPPKLQKKHNL